MISTDSKYLKSLTEFRIYAEYFNRRHTQLLDFDHSIDFGYTIFVAWPVSRPVSPHL